MVPTSNDLIVTDDELTDPTGWTGPLKVHEYVPPANPVGIGVALRATSAPASAFCAVPFKYPLTLALVILISEGIVKVKSSNPTPAASLIPRITILLIFVSEPSVKPTLDVPFP